MKNQRVNSQPLTVMSVLWLHCNQWHGCVVAAIKVCCECKAISDISVYEYLMHLCFICH